VAGWEEKTRAAASAMRLSVEWRSREAMSWDMAFTWMPLSDDGVCVGVGMNGCQWRWKWPMWIDGLMDVRGFVVMV
jgi:hypothetical protein